MNKKVLVISILIVVLVSSIIFLFITNITKSSEKYKGLPVIYSPYCKAYNTNTVESAIGTSDYIYIAKVNKIKRTDYRNPIIVKKGLFNVKEYDPYTIYEIEVIENIKGDLITNEPIELVQYGGLEKNKKSYSFLEGVRYLEEGSYYLLMSNIMEETGEIETTDPNKVKYLSVDLTKEEQETIVKEYKEYLKNEQIPEGYEKKKAEITSKYDISNYKEDN